MSIEKGFAANVEHPAHIAALAPDFILIAWGAWLADPAKRYGTVKLAIALYDADPAFPQNAANIAAVIANHTGVEIKWLVGFNEPDTWGVTPEQAAAEISAHVILVSSVDPNAVFAIANLSQLRPMFTRNYFWKIWDLLPTASVRKKIKAIAIHWYVLAEDLPDNQTFDAQPLLDHLTQTRAAMVEHEIAGRELWLTEIGLEVTTYTLLHPDDVANYLNVVKGACEGLADRFAWYAQQPLAGTKAAGYFCLQNPDGTLTALGAQF